MTIKETKKLDNGVYLLYWKSGGNSLASVGRLHDGTLWFAPSNWTNESCRYVTSTAWDIIDYVKPLYTDN